ncbi:MAG TPA: cache domain-containing protein [Burkholderiales bacterium]|nr:cache domain-containing protein [Burkholderiales bacterium]
MPAALLATALIGYDYYQRERARLVSDSLATAHAMAAAVDSELAGVRAGLTALATSPSLASGDFAAFHAQAQAAMKEQAFVNIVLLDASDRQILNTLRASGEPLPASGNPPQLHEIFRSGQAVTTGLFIGPVAKKPLVAVGVPVRHDGAVRYSLNAGIAPDRFAAIVRSERLPASWIAVVVDGSGTVVARTRDAARFVGQKATESVVEHIAREREGTFDGTTLEGIPVITVFTHAPVSGWSVVIGIPQATLLLQLWISIARLALVMFVVLGTAIGLAMLIGRGRSL